RHDVVVLSASQVAERCQRHAHDLSARCGRQLLNKRADCSGSEELMNVLLSQCQHPQHEAAFISGLRIPASPHSRQQTRHVSNTAVIDKHLSCVVAAHQHTQRGQCCLHCCVC